MIDLKVQSHGILTVGGVVALVLGLLLLVGGDASMARISYSVIGTMVVTTVIFFVFVPGAAFRAQRRKPITGVEGLIGERGTALTDLEPDACSSMGNTGRPNRRSESNGAPRSSSIGSTACGFGCAKPNEGAAMFTYSTLTLIILGVLLSSAVKVLREYERAVVFRLGRAIGTKGPGLIFLIPIVDKMVRIPLRTVAMDVPPQDVITRDNVTVKVNAVIYFRVLDANRAVLEVENYLYATSQIAQTTLRSILGESDLDQLLSNRDEINLKLQQVIDRHTEPGSR